MGPSSKKHHKAKFRPLGLSTLSAVKFNGFFKFFKVKFNSKKVKFNTKTVKFNTKKSELDFFLAISGSRHAREDLEKRKIIRI